MLFRLRVLLMLTVLAGCDMSVSQLSPSELPGTTATTDTKLPMDVTALDNKARELVVHHNWPGLSIAVGWQGELAWAHAVGFAAIAEERPLTPDMRIRIGPMTQAVTAAMLATLAEDGIIDLDVPVGQYLAELPEPYSGLTPRALLQHLAGVRDHRGEDEYISGFRHCDTTGAQLDIFVECPLAQPPYESPQHSAYGLVLAAAAAEAASDRSYQHLIERRILEPLGMTRTGVAPVAGGQVLGDPGGPGQPRSAEDAWLYWPFAATNTRYGLEHSSQSDLSCVVPAEGLVSTPSDLVRLGNALLTVELISPDRLKELFAPAQLADGQSSEYGMGWRRLELQVGDRKVTIYSHGDRSGRNDIGPGVPGGTAHLVLVPEYELVIASATNVTFARDLDDFNHALVAEIISAINTYSTTFSKQTHSGNSR